jgi:hypothetical protein
MKFEVFDNDPKALNGKAIRRQVAVYLTGKTDGPRMDLLIYLPNEVKRPMPVIFGMNFWGNHSVINDPAIRLTTSYMDQGPNNPYLDLSGVKNHRATEACRGNDAARWPVETIIARGFGFVTAYRGDIDPDIADGYNLSIKSQYPELKDRSDNFSTIGAWAWAFSRGIDYLVTDPDIDKDRIAIMGWSRLGKAAVWAAANDQRIALLISSESGSGGAKLFHHDAGESIQRLNTHFPYWYCRNFSKYNGKESTLPFDSNQTLSLVAPRPMYIASSQGDAIFDPIGEFLGPKGAEPVYKLLGAGGLPADTIPPLDVSVQGQIGYHRRTGKHNVLPFDWQQYLDFCDNHLGKGAVKSFGVGR